MSLNSQKKGTFLKNLNLDKEYLEKRRTSRKLHDQLVGRVGELLRTEGERIFIISQYVKDAQPDIIWFKDGKLIAIEIESKKRYKPSEKTIKKRKENLHFKNNFFDKVKTILLERETNPAFIKEKIKEDE